ncbi:MAG: flavin reductase family protein [Planctomycetota bacterium]
MSDDTRPIDTRALRRACGSFATGVTVITTRTEEGDHGMTANAFMSVSMNPPLLTISLDKKTRMLGHIRRSGRYAVNVLSGEMEHLAMHFAGKAQPGRGAVLLDERDGLPVLPRASAVFLTDVEQEFEVGDHVLFVGRVSEFEQNEDASPLLFCGGQFVQFPEMAST